MTSFGRKLASFLVAGSLALTGLAGCAGGGAAAPEATNTKELLALYEKAEKSNYHADLNMSISASALGQDIKMPITGSFDTADKNTHGTMEMDTSSVGGEKATIESYVVENGSSFDQYMSTDGGANWVKQQSSTGSVTDQLTDEKLLTDGEFAKTDAGYQVTVSGDKIMGALSSSTGDLTSMFGGDAGMQQALQGTKAIFAFDKQGQLTGMTMNMSYDMSETVGASASVAIDINIQMSNFGKVDAKTTAVPENVKTGATDLGALTEGLGIDDALTTTTTTTETVTEGGSAAASSATSATSAAASSATSATSAAA